MIESGRTFGRPNKVSCDSQRSNFGFTHEFVESVDPDAVAAANSLTRALGADSPDRFWREAKAGKSLLKGTRTDKAFGANFHCEQNRGPDFT